MSTVSAIVYTSNTGFTRRYAELLSGMTGLPACDLAGSAIPAKGTSVIYLGWLCAGSVKGLKKARRRYHVKAVCPVGLASEPNGKTAEELGCPVFYLRGGYAPDRLTGVYGLMMKPMAAMVGKAPAEDEKAREMRDAFAHGGDWVSAQQLEPVAAWVRGESV